MFRPQAWRPSLAVTSWLGRIPACAAKFRTPYQAPLMPSRQFAAYPKEGVFQPNSPPRNIPGFGPAPPSPQQPQTPPQYAESPGRSGLRGWLPTLRWYKVLGAALFFAVGFYKMQTSLLMLIPLEQGTEEDDEELEALFEELEEFPLVQQLRSEEKYVEGEGYKPVFREWTAYQGLNDGRRSERLTTGPLGGSAGVAAQKVFWNEQDQQLFLFVCFGPGTQGWPQAVHGGAISTICDEALGRVAIRSTEGKSAVTATLEVKFIDTVHPGQWHVLFAGMDESKLSQCTDKKKYVFGVLGCCSESGPSKEGGALKNVHLHASATGLFIVPKTTQLAPIADEF